MKSCFLTQSYKGGYIHSHVDGKDTVIRVMVKDAHEQYDSYPAKSFKHAKSIITRMSGRERTLRETKGYLVDSLK